jgi:Deoxyribose-phosphate aldolase
VDDKELKVIKETCHMTDEAKEKMSDIVCETGAEQIKTSTGSSTAGATSEDGDLMDKGEHGRCKGKAAGRHFHRGGDGKIPRSGRRQSGHSPGRSSC